MDTELGITTAHPFQLDAVLALAYKHSSLLLIRAPGDGKSAVVHAEMRLLRGVTIVVDPTLSVGENQAISATAAGLFAVYWGGLSASSAIFFGCSSPSNSGATPRLLSTYPQKPSMAKNSAAQSLPSYRRASLSFCCGVGPRWMEPPQNACFEGTSVVNTFCAANRLSLPPPCCGNAATLPLRGPWRYVVGYSPGVLGPITHSTALGSSLRPHLGLFARGSKSELCALCLSLNA
jgi:hypothetical protein